MLSKCGETMGSIEQLSQPGPRVGTGSTGRGVIPDSPLEPYVDAKEGAAFLRIHPKTLMRLARGGMVRAYSFNEGSRRHWRFLLSELDSWMRSKVNSSPHPVRSVSQGRRR